MALRPRGNRGRPEPRRDITPINERIRFPQVRVIDENNGQLGVMNTREAINLAQDRGFDLILVAAQAQPPVCRIMNYGKFKYEQSKKKSGAKKPANELKMVRLHPGTGAHDRDILVRHADRFLREGHKVRVVCQFKGRENAYPELGRQQMDAIANALAEVSTVEGQVTKQGRDMTMMLNPKAGIKPLVKGKKTEAQEAEEDALFQATQAQMAEEAGESPEAAAVDVEDEDDTEVGEDTEVGDDEADFAEDEDASEDADSSEDKA